MVLSKRRIFKDFLWNLQPTTPDAIVYLIIGRDVTQLRKNDGVL